MVTHVHLRRALRPLDRASSWASLLSACELWTLNDNAKADRDFRAQLMHEAPGGITAQPQRPHDLYLVLWRSPRTSSPRSAKSCRTRTRPPTPGALQLRRFWAETLPAALDREFTEVQVFHRNLRGPGEFSGSALTACARRGLRGPRDLGDGGRTVDVRDGLVRFDYAVFLPGDIRLSASRRLAAAMPSVWRSARSSSSRSPRRAGRGIGGGLG